MDFIRCENCNAPANPKAKACPRCDSPFSNKLKRAKQKSIDNEAQQLSDNEKVFSKMDLVAAIEEAEKRAAKKKYGNMIGIVSCIFALMGIVTSGLTFIPLAFLLAILGFIKATIGRNGGGQALNLLGFLLCVVGLIVSPSLWAVVIAWFSLGGV